MRAIALLGCTLLGLGALWSLPRAGQPYTPRSAWDGTPMFSVSRAWDDLEHLALRFPRRWSGGLDRLASAEWLIGRLRDAGLEVHREAFPTALGQREPVTVENLWGISQGGDRRDEIILVVGNYDIAPTSFQGASDTAAHVAAVLELARVIHAAPHRRTFLFLFPDGEEYGMLGARHFARTFPDRARVVAGLVVEDLDVGSLVAVAAESTGQFRGFAPMWLRSLVAIAAAGEGLPMREVSPFMEWLQRSVVVSATDQGPLLGAGIPAIQVGGRGDNPGLQAAVYHLPWDTLDNMRPGSLRGYGRVQERVLRAIDAMDRVPRESSFYLRTGPRTRVGAGPLLLAQTLAFLPLMAGVAWQARRGLLRHPLLREEGATLGAILCVLLAGLGTTIAAPKLGLMPDWELYPATTRHPQLTDVSWGAVAAVAAVAILASWVAARVWMRRVGRRPPPERPEVREEAIAASQVALLAIAVVALLDNPFGAVTFLLLPASLWVWIAPGRTTLRRVLNAVLLAMGFLLLVALLVQYNQFLRIGWYMLWYIFMGVSFGQFALLRVILALAMVAVGLRLFWINVLART